jgi:hypothetical protein
LNKYAPKDEAAARKPPALRTWAAALVYMTHMLGMSAFFMSFALAVLAALVAALGLFTQAWASVTAMACVLIAVGMILLSTAMCGITQTSHWGLSIMEPAQLEKLSCSSSSSSSRRHRKQLSRVAYQWWLIVAMALMLWLDLVI